MSFVQDSSSRAVRSLESILTVAEELLFSFVLPVEVVRKYEFVREQAMQKAGLHSTSTRIRQLQREAHAKQQEVAQSDSGTAPDREAERCEFITRLDSAHDILRSYQRMLVCVSTSFNDLGALADCMPHSRKSVPVLADMFKQSQDKPLRMSELESSHAKLMEKYKDLEIEAHAICARFIDELSTKQRDLEASLIKLKTASAQADERLTQLQRQVSAERLMSEAKLQELFEENRSLYEEQIERMEKAHSLELEMTVNEKEAAVEETKALKHELSNLKSRHEAEISELQAQSKRELDTANASFMDVQETKQHQRRASLEDMLSAIHNREEELKIKLERLASEGSSTINQLQAKFDAAKEVEEDLRTVLKLIGERVHYTYTKHSPKHRDWNAELSQRKAELIDNLEELAWSSDIILEVEFVCYLASKLTADNDWLIERLAEFGKENERLKRQSGSPQSVKPETLHKQVMDDIRSTTLMMKDFESARDRLVKQFRSTETQDPHSESPNVVANLYKKYISQLDQC